MGSAGPVWFAHKDHNLVAFGGKQGVLYLLDADLLGNKDHQTPYYIRQLSNDDRFFAGKGIWGGVSSWRDEDDETWVYVPVWGPVSTKAPAFPVTNGPRPHGCVMAFKVVIDSATKQPTLEPAWISGDFDVPEPVAIAGGVVFAVSTGENTQQTVGAQVLSTGMKRMKRRSLDKGTRILDRVLRILMVLLAACPLHALKARPASDDIEDITGKYHFLSADDKLAILEEEGKLKGYIDVYQGEEES